MIEIVESQGIQLAIIIRASFEEEGIRFFTTDESTLQMGYMKRPIGYRIAPHVHLPVKRTVEYTYEVLFIKSGRVAVDFYFEDKRYFGSRTLEKGDTILLQRGGHGFSMIETAEIIEVKQGPYAANCDKERF